MPYTKQKEQLVAITTIMFNAAPLEEYLQEFEESLKQGLSVEVIANNLGRSTLFNQQFPEGNTLQQNIDLILNRIGINSSSPAYEEASLFFNISIANGNSAGSVLNRAALFLLSTQEDTYQDAASTFKHKVEVARFFAETLKSNDLDLANSILINVNNSEDSRDRALDTLSLRRDLSDNTITVIQGDANDNILKGTDTAEIFYAFAGNDTINGGAGNNVIYADDGNDNIYTGDGNDVIYGRAGDDTIYVGGGDDLVYGNSGNDSIHLEGGNNIAYGGDGNDSIYGGPGNDIIYGDNGDDLIFSGGGNNLIYGGPGNDIITTGDDGNFVEAGEGDDIVYGGDGIDRIYGGEGNDIIYGRGNDDLLEGHEGNDILYGGAGNDKLYGGMGDDRLYGGDGDDLLYGEQGSDILDGGAGSDLLFGGAGNDLFVFRSSTSTLTAMDSIMDFEFSEDGLDQIQLVDNGNNTIFKQALNVSAATSLQAAANLATKGDGSVNSQISWFIYNEDTFIVQDLSAANTFDSATDIIIKLQGIQNLTNIDESTLLFG